MNRPHTFGLLMGLALAVPSAIVHAQDRAPPQSSTAWQDVAQDWAVMAPTLCRLMVLDLQLRKAVHDARQAGDDLLAKPLDDPDPRVLRLRQITDESRRLAESGAPRFQELRARERALSPEDRKQVAESIKRLTQHCFK